ncbi:MAG: hypothetical protein SFV19_16635 [Rhodospirillaceae bacterium]|nr:hypothetical protein [Rhodospirillaceae bacterium]
MNADITALVERIRTLENELETEFAKRREALRYRIVNRRAVFEQDVIRRHRELKATLLRYFLEARPLAILTAPVIYALIVPFALLDLCVTAYQAICFPVYGIAKARRGDFFVFDRHRLAYLNAVEKLNCVYCSYGNGVIAYVREVASRTEQYWCPIKHAQRLRAAHERYHRFVDYGDAEAYRHHLDSLRKDLMPPPP